MSPSHPLESIIPQIETLVDSFLTSCHNRGLSKHTIRWYEGVLRPFESQFTCLPDKPEPLESFIASYQTGDERRHGVYRVLRTFYNFSESRHGASNAMAKVSSPRVKPKEKQALSLEQLRILLEYPGHNPMVRALLYLLVDTGIRLGEAATLTCQGISQGSVKVNGKTGERIVPISPEVYQLLLNIMPVSTANDQRLFPYTTFWLGRLVSRAIKATSLNGFSAHSLRHTFCTLWNGSDTALKHITGHRSWRMIEHYKHRREAQASEQHRQHSPLAMLNGSNYSGGNRLPEILHESAETAAMNPSDKPILQAVIELAQQLGAAEERIRYLKSLLSPTVLAKHN